MIARRTTAAKPARRPNIEREEHLLPWVIAESVVAEAAVWLGEDLPGEWAEWLTARAARVYASSAHFRTCIRRRGTAGRDSFFMFMRHWLASHMQRKAPALFRRMPRDFANGLPAPRQPAGVAGEKWATSHVTQ